MMLTDRFQPSPGRILVKPDDAIMSAPSPIIIPERYKENDHCSKFGIVMAVGEFDETDFSRITKHGVAIARTNWTIAIGDSIIFHIHESLPIKIDGEDFFIIDVDAVLGKVNLL